MQTRPQSLTLRHLMLALPVVALPFTVSCTQMNMAPVILTQPGDVTVSVGEDAKFTVSALSVAQATYQWQRNGQNINGATQATYVLENAQGSDNNATFSVVVTNPSGSITSAAAKLTVKDAGPAIEKPVITEQPQNQAIQVGESATFKVAGTGNPTFQWKRNGQEIPGATQSTYTITQAQEGDSGAKFCAVLSNKAGSITSQEAALTVQKPQDPVIAPTITGHPKDAKIESGKPFELKIAATGTALTYQWRKNDQPIQAATAAVYSVKSAQDGDSGSYDVVVSNAAGSVTSNKAYINVYTTNGQAPSILNQPQSLTVKEGASATFAVKASGSPAPSYQWRRNSEIIDGACEASYTLSNVKQGDNGASFDVLVSNKNGKLVSNAATLTVTAVSNATAPSFTLNPSDATAKVGDKVTFKAKASGSPEPTYQWLKNGQDIANAVSESYTLTVKDADFGAKLSVKASNTAGSVTSNTATIKKATSGGDTPSGSYTVTFAAGEGGTLEGELTQTIKAGESCTSVKAVADSGLTFNFWFVEGVGTFHTPELALENVQKNMTVQAHFVKLQKLDSTSAKGQLAINIPGIDHAGQAANLADYHGQVILLDVSAGWCAPCNKMAPLIEEIAEKFKDRNVKVVTVLANGYTKSKVATQEELQKWVDEHSAKIRIMNDLSNKQAAAGIASKYYAYQGFPTFIVIDKAFKIAGVTSEFKTTTDIEALLEKLVNQ